MQGKTGENLFANGRNKAKTKKNKKKKTCF